MLKDITLGQYFPGNSVVHRLDPRTKLVMLVVYIVTLFMATNVVSYVLVAGFLFVSIKISKIPMKSIVRGMKPLVLILDEPTAGLDPVGREEILKNIEDYRRKHNATIMMVSHSMDDVARLTDRLLVMNGSHLAMDGTPAEVFTRAEELVEMGLNIPQVTRVFLELKRLGLDVEPVYTIDQAVKVLKAIKGGAV